MDDRVGIRELKQQASAVMRRVAAGEAVEVTDNGHPIARIVPLLPGPLDQLTLEGRASEAQGDLLQLAQRAGLPVRRRRGPSVALAEMRSDDR